ncbi:hypothetical protein [Desulfofundulus thermobenzoicus]|uniref:hypothetical protein n=1 Tax=Desulfofundulus thermobenzoicus TaxID=29376 RepID=UPI00128F2586|nr:hypothetical protein [Desulfofundulus thermobenzoicus]
MLYKENTGGDQMIMGGFLALFFSLLSALIGIAVLYFTIKYAVKSAIKELKDEKII